ncbi:MAG TPA: zinc ABC transporter substrate-binding protein [Ktedonobacterales bacterium]
MRTRKVGFVRRATVWAVAALLGVATISGCGLADASGGGSGQAIQVVAAENFWSSIAAQVGGARVAVTSIIRDPGADPHSYEPTAQDARAFAQARYVIVNGAGYDPWAERLLAANPVSGRVVLNIGGFLGLHAGDNPHLWYNPDFVTRVVNKIRDDLKTLDPAASAALDQSAYAYLTTGLSQYHQLIATIKAKYSGVPVGATESIFSYLAPGLGLNLITPYSYLKAVSEGQDVAAADEAAVERQITQKQIKILVYDSQNTPPNVQTLIGLARAQSIPVATITETLTPANATFQAWQTAQLQGILDALNQASK